MTTIGAHAVLHDTFTHGEEGVVAPFANVGAGMDTSASLADQDGSSGHHFAVEDLGAETFCF
jgi:hypothetical protein